MYIVILPTEVGVYTYTPTLVGFPPRIRLPDYFLNSHKPVKSPPPSPAGAFPIAPPVHPAHLRARLFRPVERAGAQRSVPSKLTRSGADPLHGGVPPHPLHHGAAQTLRYSLPHCDELPLSDYPARVDAALALVCAPGLRPEYSDMTQRHALLLAARLTASTQFTPAQLHSGRSHLALRPSNQ